MSRLLLWNHGIWQHKVPGSTKATSYICEVTYLKTYIKTQPQHFLNRYLDKSWMNLSTSDIVVNPMHRQRIRFMITDWTYLQTYSLANSQNKHSAKRIAGRGPSIKYSPRKYTGYSDESIIMQFSTESIQTIFFFMTRQWVIQQYRRTNGVLLGLSWNSITKSRHCNSYEDELVEDQINGNDLHNSNVKQWLDKET